MFNGRRTDVYYAAYVQDTIRWKNLTANLGLRYDHNILPHDERAARRRDSASPTFFRPTGTVFRGHLQPDPVHAGVREHPLELLGQAAADSLRPSSRTRDRSAAACCSFSPSGRTPRRSASSRPSAPSVRLDFDYWWRNSKNAGDQDQFFNTGIVFPLSFESGQYEGWDLRLDLAPTYGFRGFVSARPRPRDLRAALRPADCFSTPSPSTRSRADRSSSTTTRSCRSRAACTTTSRRRACGSAPTFATTPASSVARGMAISQRPRQRLRHSLRRCQPCRNGSRPEPHQGADDRGLPGGLRPDEGRRAGPAPVHGPERLRRPGSSTTSCRSSAGRTSFRLEDSSARCRSRSSPSWHARGIVAR